MKKVTIFVVAAILLAVIIGTVALAAEGRQDSRWRRGNNWNPQTTEEPETDAPKRESRDFSDEETFFNRMAAYCGRMMGGSYYEGTPRSRYGGYSCH